jgi:hypothetical protein
MFYSAVDSGPSQKRARNFYIVSINLITVCITIHDMVTDHRRLNKTTTTKEPRNHRPLPIFLFNFPVPPFSFSQPQSLQHSPSMHIKNLIPPSLSGVILDNFASSGSFLVP